MLHSQYKFTFLSIFFAIFDLLPLLFLYNYCLLIDKDYLGFIAYLSIIPNILPQFSGKKTHPKTWFSSVKSYRFFDLIFPRSSHTFQVVCHGKHPRQVCLFLSNQSHIHYRLSSLLSFLPVPLSHRTDL